MTTALKSKLFRALGTLNTIQLFDDVPGDVLERAERRVQELDDKLSVFKPDSEISFLNAAAGVKPVPLSEDTIDLLRAGKRFSAITDGAFSLTTRPLSTLWSLNARCGSVPSRGEIEQALRFVNDADLILDEQNHTGMLNQFGQAVDLGGIAKGYAADEVKRILMEGGVQNAIVNLGGTVFVLGESRTVGIQHPDRATGISMGRLSLSNRAIVTSGDYERYFEVGGVRYHHIVDPKTGYPANAGLRSVTVIGENAMALDALSTAVFVMGAEQGVALTRRLGVETVLVTAELDVYCSDTLRGVFSLLTATQKTRIYG